MPNSAKVFLLAVFTLILLTFFPFSAGTESTQRPSTNFFTHKYLVVIDPGHGGIDPGCIGYSGTEEKGITLSISKMVYTQSLSEPEIEIFLTRKTDRYIDPYDRVEYANQLGADLFISIHANAHSQQSVKGVETFIAEELNGYQVDESKKLAEAIQKNLVYRMQAKDRGIRQAPLFIRKARMPAVLAEVGFLTNPWEEAKLTTVHYQSKVATGIIRGIKDYLNILSSIS